MFNHTANNSKWLEEHPEAGYNVESAPWLESALELDDALLEYSDNLAKLDLPTNIKSSDDLSKVVAGIKVHVISKLRLWEYFAVNVKSGTEAVMSAWRKGTTKMPDGGFNGSLGGGVDAVKSWSLYQKADFLKNRGMLNGLRIDGRGSRQVDPAVAAALLNALHGRFEDASDVQSGEETIKAILNELNLPFYSEYDADVAAILDQTKGRIQYTRLDPNGPRLGPVTKENPLIETYFARLPLNETTKKHNSKSLALAVNGWIWAADAMKDNAGPDWRPYLRRELIPWSDCVKLRYGKGPEDNPYLWERMAEYCRISAK